MWTAAVYMWTYSTMASQEGHWLPGAKNGFTVWNINKLLQLLWSWGQHHKHWQWHNFYTALNTVKTSRFDRHPDKIWDAEHVHVAININFSNSLVGQTTSSKHQLQNNYNDIYTDQWNCKTTQTHISLHNLVLSTHPYQTCAPPVACPRRSTRAMQIIRSIKQQ